MSKDEPRFCLTADAAAGLMPMHLILNAPGQIISIGPTLAKLVPGPDPLGRAFAEVFALRRPVGFQSLADMRARAGERFHLAILGRDGGTLRGLAMPAPDGGIMINLSFGIGLIEAVRQYGLTDADFAHTDLAVEMLYLVEVKSVVMDELRQLNLRLHGAKLVAEQQAMTDTLTGLRNRRALDMTLAALTFHNIGFGLMHLDLDFFKQVNDSLGHAAGDHVLRMVAKALGEETRAHDTVARIGGDEFVIVFPDLTDPEKLGQISGRIIEKLSRPIDYDGQACRISASIGLTTSTSYSMPLGEQMLADADTALYASKRGGRGQSRFHDPGFAAQPSG